MACPRSDHAPRTRLLVYGYSTLVTQRNCGETVRVRTLSLVSRPQMRSTVRHFGTKGGTTSDGKMGRFTNSVFPPRRGGSEHGFAAMDSEQAASFGGIHYCDNIDKR